MRVLAARRSDPREPPAARRYRLRMVVSVAGELPARWLSPATDGVELVTVGSVSGQIAGVELSK